MTSQGSQHPKKKKKRKKRNWLFFRTVSQFFSSSQNNKKRFKTSLTVQWLQTHLPMQGTWVPSLVQEDSTCLRANKPMCHNYGSPHDHMLHKKPMLHKKRSHCDDKPVRCN